MSDADGMPRIQIDDDWKQEAQREKERLAAKAKASPSGAASPPKKQAGSRGAGRSARELPPAGFDTLVSTLASQAIMYMGGYTDPRTGQPMISLDTARYQIDLLGVLEDKTKNNLSDEEQATLASTLYELRMRYVELVHAVRDAARGRETADALA
jgi:hypothetical protein